MDHQIANGMIPVGVQTLVFEDRSKYALTPCLKSETIFFISTQDLTYLCFQKNAQWYVVPSSLASVPVMIIYVESTGIDLYVRIKQSL